MSRRFWQSVLSRLPSGRVPARRAAAFRPGLEPLEQLLLPSAVTLVPTYVRSFSPQATHFGAPAGLNPAQVRHAYGFDQISFGATKGDGSGQTIAIVDAYDDPSIAADLTTFDQQFGLAAPPSFVKVGLNAAGAASTSKFPTADPGWAGEVELDVEWAHAVAPGARILLVEANSANDNDLLNAVDYARQQPGVCAVSMSWGGGEFSGEASYDGHFTTPAGHGGVTFVASSGDSGSPSGWPALSSHVVGVGGTRLTVDASGNYLGETGWAGSGGSLSAYVAQPGYQSGLTIRNGGGTVSAGGKRAGPDVAYDADPNSGVAVYGSYGLGGWGVIGGTSAAAPQWAALMAVTDQGRALAGLAAPDGFTQTLPALYGLPAADFHDVTAGSNGGYTAGAGFDLVTGRGTPVANLVVAGLVGGTGTAPGGTNKPPTVAAAAHVVSQTPTAASLAVLGADDGGGGNLTYSWKLVGTAPAAVTFSANGTDAARNTTATFAAAGSYTFQVTITDQGGLTTTSQVAVTVNPVLTAVVVTPGTAGVVPGGKQQFAASARDQFGNALAAQPTFTWSLGSGSVGTVSASGLYTAPNASGSATVRATAGGVTGTAAVAVASSRVAFSDNFAAGAGNWTVTAGFGEFYLANVNGNNRLMVYDDGTGMSRAVAGQSSWANYSYQATLNIDMISSGSASLLARVQDNTHLYFFGYNVALGRWMIALRNGPVVTILATSAPFALVPDLDYTVRADLSGNSLKLYAGGVLQVSTTDTTYASGRIGFSATSALAWLDDVTVTLSSSTSTAAHNMAALAAILRQQDHQRHGP